MITETQDYGSTKRTKKSILRSDNGWGGATTLALDVYAETGEIENIYLDFKNIQMSGVSVDELRRLKTLLNEFPEL